MEKMDRENARQSIELTMKLHYVSNYLRTTVHSQTNTRTAILREPLLLLSRYVNIISRRETQVSLQPQIKSSRSL